MLRSRLPSPLASSVPTAITWSFTTVPAARVGRLLAPLSTPAHRACGDGSASSRLRLVLRRAAAASAAPLLDRLHGVAHNAVLALDVTRTPTLPLCRTTGVATRLGRLLTPLSTQA